MNRRDFLASTSALALSPMIGKSNAPGPNWELEWEALRQTVHASQPALIASLTPPDVSWMTLRGDGA